MHELYSSLVDNSFVPPDDGTVMPDGVERLHDAFTVCKSELVTQSRTAKLWVQYLDYIQVLKDFIRANRLYD